MNNVSKVIINTDNITRKLSKVTVNLDNVTCKYDIRSNSR